MSERTGAAETEFWADADRDTALQRFQTLVNAIDDGIYQLDPEGRFVAVNDVILEATGYGRDELLGAHASLVLADDDVSRIEAEIRRTLETGVDPPALELEMETATGDTLPCELRFTLLTVEGELQGTVGVVRDISTIAARVERERRLTRYETIVETVEDGIYVLDEEYRFVVVNQAYVEMTGYSREELLGSHCSLVVGDEVSTEAAERSLNMLGDDRGAATIEAEILRRDGERLPAESRFSPLASPDGSYHGTVGVVRDVTERKARETELQRYETIVQTVEDGIYVVDEDGHFTMVNDSFAELLEYAPDDLVGAHVSLVVDGDVHRRAREVERAIVEGAEDVPSIEAAVETASGRFVPAEATFAVLPADSDERERVGVVRDVTERRARERALEESERRYRTLVDHFPGAVGLYDESFEYAVAGGELLETVDIDTDDVVGTSVYERYSDELLEQVEPSFRAVFEGESNTFETRLHDRDLWAHTLPVRNGDGDIFAGMLLVQDISDRKAYQRQIEESNERLEQFAYAASHDLQEPLRMVSSYLQLIDRRYRDELDADAREFIAFAVDGAERMTEMIEGLLQYSRVETGGDSFEPVALDAVVDDVLDDLRVTIVETDAEIAVESLPRVTGDSRQLRQVFQNLLSNALTYSGDDPPQVHVSAERDGPEWILSVRDQGIGVDPMYRDRIFEVFQRLHSHEEYPGTGIGLALCERIVDRHGGEIWVDSVPGEGATFSLTLPATRA